MRKNILIVLVLFAISFASAATTLPVSGGFNNPSTDLGFSPSASYSYMQPNFNTYYSRDQMYSYWPILRDMENGQCNVTSDFLVTISPAGCQPMVVKSDLLEEQNVPVFCPLSAIKINPLIQVSSIKSISFKGQLPENVAGISFHPAQAAIRSYSTLLGNPLMNNIGYVVIILKRNPQEKKMPEWVGGNLTATIYYDAEKAFGTGQSEFYLPELSDEDWKDEYATSSFWQGRGFIRAEEIDNGTAKISVYTDKENVYRQLSLKEGQTSGEIYFPGFYCRASFQVKLNKVVGPEAQAELNIDGNTLWVRKGSKIINNKCTVRDLSVIDDNGGSISISCPGKTLNLILQKRGGLISVDNGEEEEFAIGSSIRGTDYYLLYAGKTPDKIGGDDFIFISKTKVSDAVIAKISKKVSELTNKKYTSTNNNNYDRNAFDKDLASTAGIKYGDGFTLLPGESKEGVKFIGFTSEGSEEDYSGSDPGKLMEEYFGQMDSEVEYLLDNYPQEKGNLNVWGEEALYNEIKIAMLINKPETQQRLIQKFTELYPSSNKNYELQNILTKSVAFDMKRASGNVYVSNSYHSISVSSFKKVDDESKNARIGVSGLGGIDITEGQEIFYNKKDKTDDYLVVRSIDVSRISFDYYDVSGTGSNRRERRESFYLSELDSMVKGNKEISVSSIDVKKVAYVSIIPRVDNTKTDANFTFKIGIEKRAIKLTPDKANEMIENLNATIKKWEDINNKLANVIKGWKGACFAGSAMLMLKTWAGGLDGETMARQDVMKAYKVECSKPEYKDMTKTQCYNKLADKINTDVATRTAAIKAANSKITQYEKNNLISKGGLFDGDVTNSTKVKQNMLDSLKDKTVSLDNGKTLDLTQVNVDDIPYDVLREKMAAESMSGLSPIAKKAFDDRLKAVSQPVYQTQQNQVALNEAISRSKSLGQGLSPTALDAGANRDKFAWGGDTARKLDGGVRSSAGLSGTEKDDTPIQIANYGGKDYLIVLQRSSTDPTRTSEMTAKEIYELNVVDGKYSLGSQAIDSANSATGKGDFSVRDIKNKFAFVSGGQCSNIYYSPKISYFETEPYKGMPGIVPFDIKNGWYAKTSQGVGGLLSSQQKSYQSSGEVSFFYVCNVGNDKLQESGDDICQSFDVNSYDKVDKFIGCPEMGRSQIKTLVEKAQQAIREAAAQYGKSNVRIIGQDIEAGVPMGDQSLTECQDFMSPEDCKLLFNLCDPVICPSSRCNLGGAYTVPNVVQSGIIGSILLCLPNWREGVIVPICLTGINAGIDSLISILKSERECLQKSIETGEHVGICDEITSIYLCEFFWRQFAPVINIIIPKMIESAYGQGTRGGGEYLTVMHSWDTLQKNIDYFKNSYAQNAFRAFQVKSVEEAGGTFCKAFIGASVPTSASLLDNLLEPESPEQFYSWFSETPYSGATVPATSQYKVYYHIFAGKDQGTQFQVYLRDPPASSYYNQNQEIVVKSGYIPKGDSADESIDFTAPAGYKELCVVVNAQQHCGFKQVSSDMGLEYIRMKYTEEQANKKDINTEEECISGSPSILPLANPNIQAGAEAATQPNIALNGIVRVCATQNPGLGIDPALGDINAGVSQAKATVKQRWTDVGYCNDPKLRCWLDQKSVDSDVKKVQAIDNAVSNVWNEYNSVQTGEKDTLMTNDEASSVLSVARKRIEMSDKGVSALKNQIISEIKGYNLYSDLKIQIEDVIGTNKVNGTIYQLNNVGGTKDNAARGPSNSQIAEAVYWRSVVYGVVVEALAEQFFPASEASSSSDETEESNSETIEEDESVASDETVVEENSEGTETTPAEASVEDWKEQLVEEYSDLKENVKINVKTGIGGSNKIYYYDSTGWHPELYSLDYAEGVIRLVESTRAIGGYIQIGNTKIENEFLKSDEEMSKEVLDLLSN